ncbi:pimeloyl-ACP methyl ester carboxylesterase [Caulobacter ginsengisoli]|uniref:Pimeloyl-ACP methyl ester carboxylesterase n=1 Tax=Caulobacter ginsengisoli TaxID=400775 RepID=A0ABU0IRB8_9CAUL|nr:alpha/beta fold hydrolase [Caulobacter ginsengisoli]MDQ0464558.1 pimeloyl-ACP methyl ester carboxylesterase [Caulobacter ginsengisoli]
MSLLNRDGVNIYYEVHGSGPAILLTHGYSASGEMWAGQVQALSKEHSLILWDMRGHARSDSPADDALYSEALTVDDMTAILDTVGVDRAVVGGLSLGGYMSLAFNRAHPDRVKALLIIDTGPGFRKDEARDAWNETSKRTAKGWETEGLARAKRAGGEVAIASHRTADGLARAARGMLAQRNSAVIDSLPNVKVPSLVLVGANDTPFLAASDYMAAKIPGATKVVLPDAGHAANIDQPAAFNAAVLGFLAGL